MLLEAKCWHGKNWKNYGKLIVQFSRWCWWLMWKSGMYRRLMASSSIRLLPSFGSLMIWKYDEIVSGEGEVGWEERKENRPIVRRRFSMLKKEISSIFQILGVLCLARLRCWCDELIFHWRFSRTNWWDRLISKRRRSFSCQKNFSYFQCIVCIGCVCRLRVVISFVVCSVLLLRLQNLSELSWNVWSKLN